METEAEVGAKMLLSVMALGLSAIFVYLIEHFLLKPERLRSKLRKQGIEGPPSSFLFGSIAEINSIKSALILPPNTNSASISHHWPSNLFPHLEHWRKRYGPMFVYTNGTIQILCVTDVEMVKEIGLSTSLSLGKPAYMSKDRGPLLGLGIASSSGPLWVHQRKIIAPEFYLDKVKGMISVMVESANSVLRSWESRVEMEGGVSEIKVDGDLRALSADVISKACFGSNYSEGEQIFLKLRALQLVMSKVTIGVPGFRYIPTKNNREIWKLEKEIERMILKVVKERSDKSSEQEQDLLQMILEGAKTLAQNDRSSLSGSVEKFMVDNCKNIYFAGHETTAITASWCLMLLATNPDWQTRVRDEVIQCCQDRPLDADAIKNMKTLTMVIQETLRLYPPAVFVVREAKEDIKLGDITIPKGINLHIPIPMLQHDPSLWGADAACFKPQRFGNGVLEACSFPQAYLPFGAGARICFGQQFAMSQLKIILSLVLSRFHLSLSPSYRHSPAFRLVVEPGNGVILLLSKL